MAAARPLVLGIALPLARLGLHRLRLRALHRPAVKNSFVDNISVGGHNMFNSSPIGEN